MLHSRTLCYFVLHHSFIFREAMPAAMVLLQPVLIPLQRSTCCHGHMPLSSSLKSDGCAVCLLFLPLLLEFPHSYPLSCKPKKILFAQMSKQAELILHCRTSFLPPPTLLSQFLGSPNYWLLFIHRKSLLLGIIGQQRGKEAFLLLSFTNIIKMAVFGFEDCIWYIIPVGRGHSINALAL